MAAYFIFNHNVLDAETLGAYDPYLRSEEQSG